MGDLWAFKVSRYTKRTKANMKFCFRTILDIFNLGRNNFRIMESWAGGLVFGFRYHCGPVGASIRPIKTTMSVMVMMRMVKMKEMEWMDVMLTSLMNERMKTQSAAGSLHA